ncbi:MAG: alpha/beta hydrolase [Rhizobiaceae bacterium]|nr:alpha/beta hydrolase [Rhizobiaceae bacterium]
MTSLILIPGMMCDARLFAPQVEHLSSEFDIQIPKLIGQNTINGYANAILKNASENFALLGLSMGGIIAMEILRIAPERVERIALLDTNPLAEKDEVKRRRFPQMEAVKQGRLVDIMRDEMKPNYLADSPLKGEILDLCMDMAIQLGSEVFIEQSQALMNRPDQTETLQSADIPALILCGRDDILCPIERHELMHDLMPHSTLEIVDGAGHLPVLEQTVITNTKITTWLKQ